MKLDLDEEKIIRQYKNGMGVNVITFMNKISWATWDKIRIKYGLEKKKKNKSWGYEGSGKIKG